MPELERGRYSNTSVPCRKPTVSNTDGNGGEIHIIKQALPENILLEQETNYEKLPIANYNY